MDVNQNFSITDQSECTVIRFLRDLELSEVLAVIDEVAKQDDGHRRLWDLTKGFSFTTNQIREIAEYGKQVWPHPSKVAYVASGDLSFGLLKMFEAYREGGGYQTKIFRNEEEALEWFREDI